MRAYGRVGGESGAGADKASGAFSGIDFDEGLSGVWRASIMVLEKI